MQKTMLRLTAAFVAGLLSGIFLWQQFVVGKLESENQKLREQSRQAESLLEENARLARERIEPDELQRLRDGQAELLRLRGQVSQLRREVQEAKAAAAKVAAQSVSQPSPTNAALDDPPVETFSAKATASVGWNQTMVVGGWKLPSGKRALVFLQPSPDSTPDAVQVSAQIVELPEALAKGFEHLKTADRETTGHGLLPSEQAKAWLAELGKTDGVTLMAGPRITTLSGRQAQVQAVDLHTSPSGQTYTTGQVIDVVPTISADKQTVELVVGAQLNLPRTPSRP